MRCSATLGTNKEVIYSIWLEKKAPDYFERDNPSETFEFEGWFCDIFIVGLHLVEDESAYQVDPKQLGFLVIPTTDLQHRQNSMVLSKALSRWKPVKWEDLKTTVEGTMNGNTMY